MGGSLGAKSINDAVIKNMNKINEKQNFQNIFSYRKKFVQRNNI